MALLLVSVLPVILPILSGPWRLIYGQYLINAPFLVALIVVLGRRARNMADRDERRFFQLLMVGFGFWLFSVLLTFPSTDLWDSATLRVLNNAGFLLFYLAVVVALELHPHVRSGEETEGLRVLDRFGSFLFLFGLVMYFFVLPRLLRLDAFWASSLALFVALDMYIILRLVGLSQGTRDKEWRATYSWLLAGVVIWGLGDMALLLMYAGTIPELDYGTIFDAIWPLSFVAVLVATRAGPYQPETRPSDLAAPREPPGMGSSWAYAVLVPSLHVVFHDFLSADLQLLAAQEGLVLSLTVVLAGVAFLHHRRLRIENRRLTQEDKESRERITHLAYHDELTGLPNREMFQDHLRLALADARRYRRKCAVLFCDLDRFKVINDSLGHDAGDQVLISTAQRLRASVRELDTVARFGGDEFPIILHGIGVPLDAARFAEKMLASLSEPMQVEGKKHVLTASVGIAVFPDDGEDESTLLRHADTAMYQAKLQGRNTYRLFTEAMNAAAEERFAIEQGLRTTRMDENFVVFYQPIMGIETGKPMGYEALLRWKHPERGFVTPGSFLAVAEQTGLIVPIGRWVLETACTWAMKVGSRTGETPSIAVNMSARQLEEPTFVGDVMAIIEKTGLDPSRLQIEIPESITADTDLIAPPLVDLSAQGVRIAVDDFGTGFAALSRIKAFPVDIVKIDQSFVRGIEPDSVGESIVRAIVTMARALDFFVVAEGVETEEEFSVIRELDCDAAQGFYLQGPAPPEVIEETLVG